MIRPDFVRAVCDDLRENGKKKPVFVPKQVFHISDDEGNSHDFTLKQCNKSAIYTIEDVSNVVEASLRVIADVLKSGDTIYIKGFGGIGLHYRKPRTSMNFATGERVVAPGRFVPRLIAGSELKRCAKFYTETANADSLEPQPIYDETDEEEDSDGGDE